LLGSEFSTKALMLAKASGADRTEVGNCVKLF
jgi:hypothetical protein